MASQPSVFPQKVFKTTPTTEAAVNSTTTEAIVNNHTTEAVGRLGSAGLGVLLWSTARWILTSFITLPSPVFAVGTQDGSVSE